MRPKISLTGRSNPTGRLHSYETLGTVDGPGLRLVVFLQGCPLRCRYCHNPDTWAFTGGRPVTVDEIVAKAQRQRPYFGATGGVTLSGGEPLAQPAFTLDLLRALRQAGLSTALDTSGSGWPGVSTAAGENHIREILHETDLVLLDIKHPDPDQFQQLTGQSITALEHFLALADEVHQRVWIRQVIVPGFNDRMADLQALVTMLKRYPQLQIRKIELLAYHTLGLAKYAELRLGNPLPDVPSLPAEQLFELQQTVNRLAQAAGLQLTP